MGIYVDKYLSIDRISEYRSELMGIAILWVVFYHFGLPGDAKALYPLRFLMMLGFNGADIFFLLSGFGLYYSFHKRPNAMAFYKKRLLRILPLFIIFVLAEILMASLANHQDIQMESIYHKILLIDFLSGKNVYHWFIASIIACYLIFPLMYYIMEKGLIYVIFCFSLLMAYVLTFYIGFTHNDRFLYNFFLTRIPSFVFGVYIGKISKLENRQEKFFLSKSFVYTSVIACFLYYPLLFKFVRNDIPWRYGFIFYPSCIFSYSLSMLIADLLGKIRYKRYSTFLVKFIRNVGISSLELYFVHMLLLGCPIRLTSINLPIDPLLVMLSVVISLLIKWLLSSTTKDNILGRVNP